VTALKLREKTIRTDENGLICLTDIYQAGQYGTHQTPNDWWRIQATQSLAKALLAKLPANTRQSNPPQMCEIYWGRRGVGGAVYAHPILACAYAGYLSPELEIEVREVWLRYRAGDPTLADDVLERASPEANLWVASRAEARAIRNGYTTTLRDHEVNGRGYQYCTDEAYLKLFDAPAWKLRQQRGLPTGTNLRDKFDIVELSAIKLTEAMATQRITVEDSRGNTECKEATGRTAANVRYAIELELRDRQKRLPR